LIGVRMMKKSQRRLAVFRPWNLLIVIIAFGVIFYIIKNRTRIPETDIPVKYYFIIGIIASLGMLACFTRRLMRHLKLYRWETATATIVGSRVNRIDGYFDSGAGYEPVIGYKHTVGVKEYISGRINPSEGWASSFPFIAEKLVNKYPEGKTVRVLYDPARSDKSILEGAMLFPSLAFILMGVLALVVSILAVAGVMGV